MTAKPVQEPEPWLRGPVPGVPPLLQPVAHALLQAREDIRRVVTPLDSRALWARPGHSASFEHASIAEVDGEVAGVLIAYPARDRYRLHRGLLLASLRQLSPRRWPLLIAGLPQLVLASPRPPRDAYYVGTIAVARRARRRGVGFTLGHHAEADAAAHGFPLIAAHTGARHAVARHALEKFGLRLARMRGRGYALYVKAVESR